MTTSVPTDYRETPQWLAATASGARLLASRETSSGQVFFPPIPGSSPLSSRYQTITLSEHAVLYSYTIIHPNKKSQLPPFALVYADFPEQVRVFGRYHGRPDERPQIGQALRLVITDDALGLQHYAFQPA